MATASVVLSEDQFQCSICLDVFTEPVSIPCGHNFCQACLALHLEGKTQCQCPLCNRRFNAGLRLCVNTAFRDVAESFKKQHAAADADVPVGPGQVPCDCCLDNAMKASKTCLACLASFCKLHLEPHQRVAAFKRHKLVDPVENLQDKLCEEHNGILELSCRTDETRVCILCQEHGCPAAAPVEGGRADREARMRESPEEEEIKLREWRKSRGRRQRKRKGNSEERAAGTQPDGERGPSSPHASAWSDCTHMPSSRGASFGRWYYEVRTEGNTCWDVGAVRESARWDRNANHANGKWVIRFGYCNFRALQTIPVLGRKPETLIVRVDYEEGLVSFYDADTAALLHMFTGCEFRERVFLFFRPSHPRHVSCARRLLRPAEKPQKCKDVHLLEVLTLLMLWMIYCALIKDRG